MKLTTTQAAARLAISEARVAEARKVRKNTITRAKRQHGEVRVQDSYHGAGRYSVQVFAADKLVADVNL